MSGVDAAVVRFLNAGVGKFPPFDMVMEALVSDYLVPVAGSLALVGLWFYGDAASRPLNQATTMAAVAAIGIANFATAVIDDVVDRARPFVDHDLNLLFYPPTDPSFPSNAAAAGFALATPVFLRRRGLGAALFLLAFLWGFARVYAGVHYPGDVLAGAAIGAASGVLAAGAFAAGSVIVRFILRLMRFVYAA